MKNFPWEVQSKKVFFIGQHTSLTVLYVIVKASLCVYEKYSIGGVGGGEGGVERLIQHEAKLSAVFASQHTPSCCIFHTHKHRRCFNCTSWSSYLVQLSRVPKSLQSLLIKMPVSVYKIDF